jgi:hypothetical protein
VKDRTLMGPVPENGWGELLREMDEEARDHVRVATWFIKRAQPF